MAVPYIIGDPYLDANFAAFPSTGPTGPQGAVGFGIDGQDGQDAVGRPPGLTLPLANSIVAGSGVSVTSGPGPVVTVSATGSGGSVTTIGVPTPQGRLSLTTGVAVVLANQTAQGTVYYTPYTGAIVPVYNGTNWVLFSMASDLSMALDTTNQLLNNIYDLFAWSNSGTLSIGAGPAWVNTATVTWTSASPGVCTWTGHGLQEGAPVIFTAGTSTPTGITAGTTYFVGRTPGTNSFSVATSIANAATGTFVNTSSTGVGTQTGTNHTSARGTGAGTTEITQLNGLWVNKNSITLTNGAGAGTSGIAANTATYLGSIFCTANGQTDMNLAPSPASGGSNNILGVYNAYNRVTIRSHNLDSTSSWAYSTNTWRAADGNVNNRITYIDGLKLSLPRSISSGGGFTSGSGRCQIASLLNSTNSTPAIIVSIGTGGTANAGATASVSDVFFPQLGYNYAQAVENGVAASATFQGAGIQSISLDVDL